MSNKFINTNLAMGTVLLSLSSFNTWALQQSDETQQAPSTKPAEAEPMDHSKMDHSKMDHSAMGHAAKPKVEPELDHSKMDHSKMGHESMTEQDDMQGMDHSKMDHSKMGHESMTEQNDMQGMDHSAMAKQSNTAPPDARDPHAYANGLTLDSGAFALPGPRQLKMADEHAFWTVMFDRFEYADGLSSGVEQAKQYDMQGWYGNSYDRLVITSEGEIVDNKLEGSENQILWGHAISTFWDTQVGVRFDTSEGPSRQWLTFGVQGLAPYWFEVSASLSVGAEGRSVIDAEAEYELLITQRLVIQPRVVVSAYGKDDPQNGVGKGLSSLTAGLRLRYEFSRQFAPYVGLEWTGQYGNTADFSQLDGRATRQTQWVAGIRFWFQ